MASHKVTVKCGTIDSSYKGVAAPVLEAKFLQTKEEQDKYAPLMKQLVENGLPVEGTTISGI